jgi:hypothetical protein
MYIRFKSTARPSKAAQRAMAKERAVMDEFLDLGDEWGNNIREKLEASQRTWKHKGEVIVETYQEYNGDFVTVVDVFNPEEMYERGVDNLFGLVNNGTEEHTIEAHNEDTPLAFLWDGRKRNYEPRTQPHVLDSFAGSLPNRLVKMQIVTHPGFEPRRFLEGATKDTGVEFKRSVRSTMHRVVRIIDPELEYLI